MSFEIPEHLLVDGIRELDLHAIANRSQLLTPREFDKNQFVGKWCFIGASAEAAQLPQRIHGTKHAVDGWQIWKDSKGEVCERPLGTKKAILLFRPKVLQQAVNAIYGNMSKDRTIAEQQGRTVQGQNVPAGILPGPSLKGYDPKADAESEPIGYSFNKVPAIRTPSGGTVAKEIRAKGSRPRKVAAQT